MAPALDRRNVLEGPVNVYFGNSAYAVSPDTMPADSVPLSGNVGGNWRSAGYTNDDGVVESFEIDRGEVMTAQQRHPVLRPVNGYTDTISGTLLETTLENLRDILGRGTISTVASGSGTRGHKELRLTDATDQTIAVLVEGIAPPSDGGMPRRILYPAVQATATVELTQAMGETGATSGAAFEFTRVGGAESEIFIRDVLAPLP